MGLVEPLQRKGRLPQYALHQLLETFDELEALGVFKRTEDINIPVEYLNPSFLIKKPSGGYRLVTAFADVGRYCKPQSSLTRPDVDYTLRLIAQWKHIITTDLTSALYQIPLSRDSMKHCRVATPYTRMATLHLNKTHPRFCYQAHVNPTHTQWQWASPVPAAPPGWPHSCNVPIYATHTCIYNREHVLRKSSPMQHEGCSKVPECRYHCQGRLTRC